MKIKTLITKLKRFSPNMDILLSSDEEGNTMFNGIEIEDVDFNGDIKVVMFGLSGTEEE